MSLFLTQSEDFKTIFNIKDFNIVSKNKPTRSQLKSLIFAFNVCRNVKSNAIVLVSKRWGNCWNRLWATK